MSEQQIKKNPILVEAWQKFAEYDYNSIKLKKSFQKFQYWILALGGLATLLVLLQTQFFKNPGDKALASVGKALYFIIILVPITITVLAAVSNRFKLGNKWIHLRAAAEKIKSEIYRFRLLASFNSARPDTGESWDQYLWKKLTDINNRLMQSEVCQTAVNKYKGPIPPDMGGDPNKDDGFSILSAEQYIDLRIDDQLYYYKKNTIKMERKLKWCLWLIYIMGGIGTFLAAIKLELWVALTTSIVGIFTTYLEYVQVENNLMIFNQAISSLTDIKTWWSILPADQMQKGENIQKLLDSAENIFQAEQNRWMQNMETAMENLREKQKPPVVKGDKQ